MRVNHQFQSLDHDETMNINGGLAPIAVFGLGVLGAALAAGANEIVEESTGKGIGDHVVDAAIWVWNSIS